MCGCSCADELIQDITKLLTEEYRDHCRRCFVSTKSLVVSDICCGLTEKVCMCVYSLEDTGQDEKELNVLMRCLARIQKVDPVICSQGPVIVLTGTIDSCEWFLMEQAAHTVTARYFLEDAHHDLVMVCCDVCRCIDRSQLMLCRCNFVVLCLGCHAQFPAFFVDFFHISGNPLTDGSEIMVIHLLSFRRHCSEQSPSCICKVFSLKPFFLIYKEVFLLCADRRSYFLRGGISKKSDET